MEKKEIKISDIIMDEEIQSRFELKQEHIDDYAEDIESGAEFPPVELFFDGIYHFLADGFHRYQAYKKAGKTTIPSIIHQGDRRKAILFAVGVNAKHGIRRTNADKERAVRKLLMDDEWGLWSDGEIAKQCAVSQPFVSKLRRELTQNGFESPTERKCGDGKTRETANIGKEKSSDVVEENDSEAEELPNGEEAHTETGEVEIDASDKEPPSSSDKPVKPSDNESQEDQIEKNNITEGETSEDFSEGELKSRLSDLRESINDHLTNLNKVKEILSNENNPSKINWEGLEQAVKDLKNTYRKVIKQMTDLLD